MGVPVVIAIQGAYRRKGKDLPKWQREAAGLASRFPLEPTKSEQITPEELAERRRIEALHGEEK